MPKIIKNLFALIFVIAISLTIVPIIETQAGYGSEEKFLLPIEAPDPTAIEIFTAQDLWNVRNDLTGSYVLMKDIDLSTVNGGEWVPIGNYATKFTGIFDGQGYIIKNLRITNGSVEETSPGYYYTYVGLFGYVDNGTIKNIGLKNSYIDISSSSSSVYAGGISGMSALSSSITNCFYSGTISVSAEYKDSYGGGICGVSWGIISNCYNIGNISASHFTNYNSTVGGICGESLYIYNCYNAGNISAFAMNYACAGGISGSANIFHPNYDQYINNCFNTGNIYTSGDSFANSGGICGSSYADINNCYNVGMVSASSDSSYNYEVIAGGICGSASDANYPSAIRNCYNKGSISAFSPSDNHLAHADGTAAGGITGYSHEDTTVIEKTFCLSDRIIAENTGIPSHFYSHLIGFGQKSNTFALTNISGNATDDSDGLISLVEAKNQSTYESLGWDFTSVWIMISGYDYPHLQGFGNPPIQIITPTPSPTPIPMPTQTVAPSSIPTSTQTNQPTYSKTTDKPTIIPTQTPTTEATSTSTPQENVGADSIAKAEDVNVGVKLEWTPHKSLKKYRIYRSTNEDDKGKTICENIDGTEFVDVNVDSNTTYFYTIYVLDEDENGNIIEIELVFEMQETTVETDMILGADWGRHRNYILMKVDKDTILYNELTLEIDPGRGTTPVIINGRTLMPIRAVIETMGGYVDWYDDERIVSLNVGEYNVEMKIESLDYTVNYEQLKLDVAPQIINDRTMLPIRFVAENIGSLIQWIGSTQEVIIVF